MTTLAELAESFNTVVTAVDLADAYDAGVPADEVTLKRGRMASQLVAAWCREMDAFLGDNGAGRAVAPPPSQPILPLGAAAEPAAPQAPAQGPLADALAKIAAGLKQTPAAILPPPTSVPAPAPSPEVRGSFDEWVALSDALGRNVSDLVRQWHSVKDGIEGGWDKATDEQRAEQMRKALAYYANKTAEPGEIDYTVCYVCGSKGRELKTRNGELFYACSNERCGFNGREGKFINTTWDPTTYSEKRAKWQAGRQRAQQRGSYARR